MIFFCEHPMGMVILPNNVLYLPTTLGQVFFPAPVSYRITNNQAQL